MYHIVKQVLDVAEKNEVTEIQALVLIVGETSGVIPKYLEACYGAASDGTLLEKSKLEIEVVPANGRCAGCGKIFNIPQNRRICPDCGSEKYEQLSGRELLIKEIRAR